MEAVAGAGQRREALAAAREALTGLGSVLWQVGGAELGPVLTEIDDLIRLGEAARVAVVGEALERGEAYSYTGSTPDPATDSDESEQSGHADAGDVGAIAAGLTGVPWVREWAPSLRAGGASRLMRLTERLRDPKADQLGEAVESGRVGVANAVVPGRDGPVDPAALLAGRADGVAGTDRPRRPVRATGDPRRPAAAAGRLPSRR